MSHIVYKLVGARAGFHSWTEACMQTPISAMSKDFLNTCVWSGKSGSRVDDSVTSYLALVRWFSPCPGNRVRFDIPTEEQIILFRGKYIAKRQSLKCRGKVLQDAQCADMQSALLAFNDSRGVHSHFSTRIGSAEAT